MATRTGINATNLAIGGLLLTAGVIAVVAVLRIDMFGDRQGGEPGSLGEELKPLREIDPALIGYRQTGEIPISLKRPAAIAVDQENRIYVGGDKVVLVMNSDGTKHSEIALSQTPRCLTVGNSEHLHPGRIYVGMKDHVEVIDAPDQPPTVWESLGEKAVVTSIAASEEDVFVADAGSRIVWRYDTSGKLLGEIGRRDARRNIPGFVVPSPYFDLAVAPDGLLRVVNPGALRIEAYTFDGDLELYWGEASSKLEGFFGCCNPSHFSLLPDGRFVTAEKGLPRVKVYDAAGKFQCAVVGPQQLQAKPADIATDQNGRILILDKHTSSVRIFEPKP